MTYSCPFNCSICLMNSKQIDQQQILSDNLDYQEGNELNYEEKSSLIRELSLCSNIKPYIDFSGGEPLCNSGNIKIIKRATTLFGINNISINQTGYFLDDYISSNFKVNEIHFSIDCLPNQVPNYRQPTYISNNWQGIRKAIMHGISVTVNIVITKSFVKFVDIETLYQMLNEMGIDRILLMGFYPVGRGSKLHNEIPSSEDCKNAVELFKFYRNKLQGPKLIIDNMLKQYLEIDFYCCGCNTIQIFPDGTFSYCPWAISKDGISLNPEFIIGKYPESNVKNIIFSSQRTKIKEKIRNLPNFCRLSYYIKYNRASERMPRI